MILKRRIQALVIVVIFIFITIMPIGTNFIQALEEDNQSLVTRPGLTDIENHWANEYIEQLYYDTIINGYPDGTFRPENSITRAEMAVILVNALALAPITDPQLTFEDSSDIQLWAAGSIAKLVELNIINGYPDGTFMPNKKILRSEIAVMVVKSQNILVDPQAQTDFADNDEIPDWAIGYVAKATELNIIIGNLIDEVYYFKPLNNASRAEVCVMIEKMRNLDTPTPTPTPTQTQIPTLTPTPQAPGVNLIPFDKDTTINTIQSPWKLLGPGGAGAMFSPTVSYTDPNTAMIASDMTGTFITHDGGANWSIVNLRSRVDAIAFDPNEANTIYAASTGLFKSIDNGDSWKLIYPNPDLEISESMIGDHAEHSFKAKDNWPGGITQSIYIDPQNSDNIYLGIKTSTLNIYYSTNKGTSWTKGPNIAASTIKKMYIDPNSPIDNRGIYLFTENSLYQLSPITFAPTKIPFPSRISSVKSATCGVNPTNDKSIFYLTTKTIWNSGTFMSGVMKSEDYGITWTEMQTGLNKDLGFEVWRDFRSIATSLNDARTVYVSVERPYNYINGTYLGMLKSVDEGESWDWTIKVGSEYPANFNKGWYERNYDPDWVGAPKHISVGPNSPETVYYTGIGMAVSTKNGGTDWDQVYSKDNIDGTSSSNGLEVTTTYGVHFNPFDQNHIVTTYTDMGLSQSFDNRESWSHAINGVPYAWKNTCYWMVFDPDVQGRSWSAWASAHDLPREKMFRAGKLTDPSRNYVGGVLKSNDNITSWQLSNNGLPSNTIATHIVLDPQSPVGNRTLYVTAAGIGVFKSTDDGSTWTKKSDGISTANLNAWRMVITPDGTLYLLVMRALDGGVQINGAMYKSTNGAESWEKVDMPYGVNAPNDMISDPTDSKHMYLAAWPKKVNGMEEKGGLYETTDGGLTWENIYDQTAHVYSVAIDPFDPLTLYIVTFDGAAYMTEDNGQNWSIIQGYNFKWGHRPIPDPYNKGMIYITTFGSSVWYGPAKQVDK